MSTSTLAASTTGGVSDYPSVKVGGNVLPAEVIPAVSAHRLPRMSAGDYDLPLGMTPDNAAAHAYTYLQPVWQAWSQRLIDSSLTGEAAAEFTRDHWLLPMLKALGYEGASTPVPCRRGITISTGFRDETATYAISHEIVHARDSHDRVCSSLPLHLTGPDVDLDDRASNERGARAPHSMVQEFLNRTPSSLYGLLTNGHTLRLLRDITNLDRQAYLEFDLDQMFGNNLQRDFRLMWLLLHATRFTPTVPAALASQEPDDESDPEPANDAVHDDGSDDDVEVPALAVPAIASPATCCLEAWRAAVFNEGTRALDALRDGIAAAITTLGTGFVRHPANSDLRVQLASTPSADDDLRRWLLRAVYRLIILFVAEDRDLLHPTTSSQAQREAYARYFSTRRLRDLASTSNGSRHHDLWEAHRVVTDALGGDGLHDLGVPGLGSSLYEPDALGLLGDARISNHYLLAAVRHLSLVIDKHGIRRPVDYRNLDSEELGGAYEALLAYVPRYTPAEQAGDHSFTLALAPGSERKRSGAYYTPSSLISIVLDQALDPLVHEAMRHEDPAATLLSLTVVDPACGSGHFLVAAARRLARALATARTGDPEPSPEALRSAMREVVAHCIYGVDLNDLAVEITRVALWLESLEPGMPFAFLDHHVKQGNAVVGATPDLLRANIPDATFKALLGDDADTTRRLKRTNKAERDTARAQQAALFDEFDLLPEVAMRSLTSSAETLERKPQRTLADVRAIAATWRRADADPELAKARLVADAWCAAFMQHKPAGIDHIGITHGILDRLASDQQVPQTVVDEVRRLYAQHRYFHWHLEFPQVFNGPQAGFSCVVGNPPWELVQLNEKEFFGSCGRTDIESQKNGARRKALITALEHEDPVLWESYQAALRDTAATAHFVQQSGRYPLTARGKIDYYPLFAEHNTTITGQGGRAGFLTPTGLAVDKTRSDFFRSLTSTRRLATFYDFINGGVFFPSVDSRFRFAISVISRDPSDTLTLAFLVTNTSDIPSRLITLTAEDVLRMNPNTGTLPLLADQRDAEILAAVYRRFPVIRREGDPNGNPWDLTPGAMFNMTSDADHFVSLADVQGGVQDGYARVLDGVRYLPLYEGKHFWLYDHRYSTSTGVSDPNKPRPLTAAEQGDSRTEIEPRYWINAATVEAIWRARDYQHSWDLMFRKISNASNARTMVLGVVPRTAVGAQNVACTSASAAMCFVAIVSSVPFDWILRCKMSGSNLNIFLLDQIAIPTPVSLSDPAPFDPLSTWCEWLLPRVLELTYTSHSLQGWAQDLGCEGPPFAWDPARRRLLQAEIDAAMFHLYGHDRSTTEYILDSFAALRRAEEREFGEFTTRRLVLAAYDDMAARIAR